MSIQKQKKLSFILSVILVLVIIVAIFIRKSRAWFASDADPVIYSDTMMIASSEGLTIQVEDKDAVIQGVYEEINIKDIANDINQYVMLSQLSSSNGKTMFKRSETNGLITYKEVTDTKGYIEVTFALYNADDGSHSSRIVYITDMELYLTDGDGNKISDSEKYAEDIVRISLEIEIDQNNSTTTILSIDDNANRFNRHDNFLDTDSVPYNTSDIYQDTSNIFYVLNNAISKPGLSDETPTAALTNAYNTGILEPTNLPIDCRQPQVVYYASHFMKEFVTHSAGGDTVTPNPGYSIITTIPSAQSKKITFRLWLEGSDPRCDIPITGSKLYLYLKFGNERVSN